MESNCNMSARYTCIPQKSIRNFLYLQKLHDSLIPTIMWFVNKQKGTVTASCRRKRTQWEKGKENYPNRKRKERNRMESLKGMPFRGQSGHWKVPFFGLRSPWNKIILWFQRIQRKGIFEEICHIPLSNLQKLFLNWCFGWRNRFCKIINRFCKP